MVTKTYKSFADLTSTPNPIKSNLREPTAARKYTAKEKQMQKMVPGVLTKKGVKFESQDDGALLVIPYVEGILVDYWPGAGRWQERKVNPQGGWGIQSLFEYLGVET